MAGRHPAGLGTLLLIVAAGCQSGFPKSTVQRGAAPIPGLNAARERMAPPAQSGAACLAAARELEKAGHLPEALQLYERARGFDAKLDAQCSHRLGAIQTQRGELRLAEAELRRALAAKPNDPDLLNDLGYVHYQQRQPNEAEQAFRQALALQPKHSRAWINLGLLYGGAGRYDESLRAFQQSLPDGEARCNVALLQAKAGQREPALASLRTLAAERPDLKVAKAALAALEAGPAPAGNPSGILPASFTAPLRE